MYQKSNGQKGFSFMRWINNAEPNFARDAKDDVDLSLKQQNDLFRWQLLQANPALLGEKSFFIAGIVGNESQSPQLYRNLLKNGVLNPETGVIDTSKITKHFANQLATISVHQQRKLVGMLFFWEEEVMRWRLLDEEKGEILQAMEGVDEGHADLDVALKVVEAKKTMPPSMRDQDVAETDLPAYTSR
ncbi:MAG: hypothetical protein M1827_000970 [Pycnora praestabilis]|nr:MAG: hypothetical protein M1827_000970 [Pycnora praestabilis]